MARRAAAWNPFAAWSVFLVDMEQTYSWPWVQAQVAQTIERWHR
jgi:hypothetical protein